MIEMAFKNIFKRKTRSILTILGILVVMLLYIVIAGIMHTYEKDLQKQLTSMEGRVIVQMKTDNGTGGFYSLDAMIKESDGKNILALNNVDLQKSTMVFYESLVGTWKPSLPPTVLCAGIEPGKEDAYFASAEVKGSSRLKGEYEVILGNYAAMYFETEQGAKLGDVISIKNKQFKIIGILPDISSVINNSMIMPLKTAQGMFMRDGLISSVIVTSQGAEKTEELAAEIAAKNPGLMAVTQNEMKNYTEHMLLDLRRFMSMVGNTIIVVAVIIIMIVMVLSVSERRKEIGTLKAIGAPGFKILGLIVIESLALSLIGGLLALPVSIPFERVMMSEVYTDVRMWVQTLIVTVILGVISGLWPAWLAQRVNPLESLRYE